MIWLERSDKSVVVGAQDCTCTNHAGPHWIHTDVLWRKANQRMRDEGNAKGYIVAEAQRLREKGRHMEQNNIIAIHTLSIGDMVLTGVGIGHVTAISPDDAQICVRIRTPRDIAGELVWRPVQGVYIQHEAAE